MNRKNTVGTLLEMKQRGEKISMVTCYDYSMSRLVDAAGINTILVGDSLGMTMQGYDTTLPVTMEEMIIYGRSVVRGCQNAFVVMDMPFMSYQVSAAQAVENAGRLIKETNANAVKLEGGAAVAEQIKMIVDAGIPVNAHIGMTPQSVNVFGGFKVQGKGEANARRVLEDALAVQEAGAFMVTLECVPPKLAKLITSKVDMITIGIGAGAGCDGQVLVCQDLLGMNMDFVPKFVKRFGEVGPAIKQAFQDYDAAVKDGTFPALEQSFVKSDCSDEFLAKLDKEF
ncbi:MAG: 3-methyl-2-oxobutanoate hydroxymethyltransferase [Acidaminococcaceae bacterium]|nr:3-methyl-2-oxobutanoate hydroxymethyltransferase [Acidaminococcaceae bacterium]MBR1661516.1 3-methyl-2-oxobutanoate hydroxymethyltransferase [Acidaminococcaceae bacterium]